MSNYDSYSAKAFRYTTPTLTIQPEHLRQTCLLGARSFHFFVDPTQIIEQTTRLLELRDARGLTTRPIVIWEPKSYSCMPENLSAFVKAVQSVNIFSPNHIELARIVSKDVPPMLDEDFFEDLCAPFFSSQTVGSFSQGALVVRAGDQGCYVKSHAEQKWLPAYYAPPNKVETNDCVPKVVDTTGAGNAFLGALTVSLLARPNDAIFAACAGNVAASFVVEQVGVPTLSLSVDGAELWNGADVSGRFQTYRARLDHG